MEIKAKIKFEDYWRFYKKNYLFRYGFIILLFFIPLLFYAEYIFHDEFETQDLWIYNIILLLFILFTFYRIYFRTKKAFLSNTRIQENHTYIFSEENIKIKGETFESIFEWKSLYQVKEVKDWFLLYQSSQTMNLVPKKDLTPPQIKELRQLILRNHGKAKLRND